MATWFDKVKEKKGGDIPDMFKDKSEDDIVKMMKEAAAAKDQVTTLLEKDKANEVAVDKIRTEFEAMKARLVAAEAKATPTKKQDDEPDPNFVENPAEAFNKHNAPTLNLTVQTAMTTARMMAQQQLLNADAASGNKMMDGRLFQAWASELDSESKKYPAITLVKVEAWLGIFYYLKGLHADELRDPEARKKKYSFLEPAAQNQGGTPPEGDGKPKTGAESLTEQEKHVADKMKVSYENYAKRKAAMNISPA